LRVTLARVHVCRFVCVTFPCACILRMHRDVLGNAERLLNIGLIAFTVLVSVAATVEAGARIVARAAADSIVRV
jgi:hypothetical protein